MHGLILDNFAMHISLSDEEKEHVLFKLQYKKIKKNTALLKAGKVCANIDFVQSTPHGITLVFLKKEI
ncbi:hypothetical protein A9P82_10390 [Arachidicoccus ginsenosidimutans]|uniref:hypothetical protein n=1 Tax=Arachidicoccus sp. BS20 TaxID=1850526 RepID=UPI0007F09D5E|nr:hypothetical protein [Arachidicoccus sp. BS20]ANI89660.1 hypothetical protein A9P82_10390 [Arachidicoccus sp. BS20]